MKTPKTKIRYTKLLRAYRISVETDILIKTEVLRLAAAGEKVSEADLIERAIAKWLCVDAPAPAMEVVAPAPKAKEVKHIKTVSVLMTAQEKLDYWRSTRQPLQRPKDKH